IDLTASSAVNLPMTSASLRLVVVWMGVRSIRCTYSAARVPLRFTFTRNLVFFMVSPPGQGIKLLMANNMEPTVKPCNGWQRQKVIALSKVHSIEKLQMGLWFQKAERARKYISLSYNISLVCH